MGQSSSRANDDVVLPFVKEEEPSVTIDSVFEFYQDTLFPAIVASIPILIDRISRDLRSVLSSGWEAFLLLLLPSYMRDRGEENTVHWNTIGRAIGNLPLLDHIENRTSSLSDFIFRYFDTNGDGHISKEEIISFELKLTNSTINIPEIADLLIYQASTKWTLWQQAWPMTDWKIGVFLWRTCGGLLLFITLCTIIPGRLHRWSGRILRWPILGITYVMITVELMVYIVIRLFIKLVEFTVANSKHRALRRRCANAKSYAEWFSVAKMLDRSKGGDIWIYSTEDEISTRHNWSFIRELIVDMKVARKTNNSIMALAILQQCTRKNVGGVMHEELFSCTHTGECKFVVREFLDEAVETLRWVTAGAKTIPLETNTINVPRDEDEIASKSSARSDSSYKAKLLSETKAEKKKVHKALFSWEALFLDAGETCAKANTPDRDNSTITNPLNKEESGIAVSPSVTESTAQPSDHPSNGANLFNKLPLGISLGESATVKKSVKRLPACHREEVKIFLKRARAAYGRTALCLSGGAMMGNYHFGIVKALMEQDCLPDIISGTSAGSVIGALVCTRSADELKRDFKPEVLQPHLTCFSKRWPDRLKSLWHNGHLFDNQDWLDLIRWFTCGDLTFEEAYKKTGRVLCITLSATHQKAPPVLLNYISSPHVVIASAIVASAAVPGFVKPVTLQIKDSNGNVNNQAEHKDQLYWDGSIKQDIPLSGLAEMFNCQFFVTAQCNPHIVPFFYAWKGGVGRPSRWSSGSGDNSWRGGFLLSALELYLKNDMTAKFRFLDDLEAANKIISSMFTQVTYSGTTTIVPDTVLRDYFVLFTDPTLHDMRRFFKGGNVAAYQHCAMIKEHYKVARALEECLASLEADEYEGLPFKPIRRRMSQFRTQADERTKFGGITSSGKVDCIDDNTTMTDSCSDGYDDECENSGFDGIECSIAPKRFEGNFGLK